MSGVEPKASPRNEIRCGLADHSYAAIAPAATIQVAASVIVTAVLTPMLTAWAYKRAQKRSGVVPRATLVNEEGQVELDKSQGAVNQG